MNWRSEALNRVVGGVVFGLCIAIMPTSALGAPSKLTPTSGSVKLNPAQYKAVTGARCGKFSRRWEPGERTRGSFISHSKRASNYSVLARRMSGRRATVFRAAAAKYRKLRKQQLASCQLPNGSIKAVASQLKRVGQVSCTTGGLGWVPGLSIGMYFVSHRQQEKNYRTEARYSSTSKARAKLLATAAKFKTLHDQQVDDCNGLVRINLMGAAGLALTPQIGIGSSRSRGTRARVRTASTDGSNLAVVMPDGQLKDAVTSGRAEVRKLLIAPNGKAYILLAQRVLIARDVQCLLVEISPDGTSPRCVDPSLLVLDAYRLMVQLKSRTHWHSL